MRAPLGLPTFRALIVLGGLAAAGPAAGAAQADDTIGAGFASALAPALGVSADQADIYTVEEPNAFRLWGAAPPATATHACARSVALAVEVEGAPLGVFWLGVCRAGTEVPADLLERAVVDAHRAALDPEVAPQARALGALAARRLLDGSVPLVEVAVLPRRGATPSVLRTVLLARGADEVLVLQYEAVRLCSSAAVPLCREPAAAVDGLARRLLAGLDRTR